MRSDSSMSEDMPGTHTNVAVVTPARRKDADTEGENL